MSRIGKQIIVIPPGVTVKKENSVIYVKGPKGELSRSFRENKVACDIVEGQATFSLQENSIAAKKLWGTYASHLKNMIEGVSRGFEKKLEIEGVGYRAQVNGNTLVLMLGFSHPVEVKSKENITLKVEKNVITISGIDKEKVGEMAAFIRSIKKPEPYKGKGIRYQGEFIRRKAGKKAATAAA